MSTALFDDDCFLLHDTGRGHPERADRLRAVRRALEDAGLMGRMVRLPFEAASREVLGRLHDPRYVDRVFAACDMGESCVDTPDAPCNRHTAEVASLGVGAGLAAVSAVVSGAVSNAFCLVRPPGHHAGRGRSMGFCFFNTIALAADAAIRDHGLSRVAILDWDVHHGNGTQHLLEHRSDILFISLHGHPATLYPGTGHAQERGLGEGEGYTLNLPLAPGADDADWLAALDRHALPAVRDFKPELLLISAGFDAHAADPLGDHRLTAEGFTAMTCRAMASADRCCGGRVVSVLEGGYDLAALGESVAGHVGALMSQRSPDRPA